MVLGEKNHDFDEKLNLKFNQTVSSTFLFFETKKNIFQKNIFFDLVANWILRREKWIESMKKANVGQKFVTFFKEKTTKVLE